MTTNSAKKFWTTRTGSPRKSNAAIKNGRISASIIRIACKNLVAYSDGSCWTKFLQVFSFQRNALSKKTAKSSNVISSNETSQILVSREYQIFVTHNRNDSGDAERIFSAILIVVLLSVYRLPPYFSPQMEINIMKILK